jgi:hypothetical protein
VSGRALLTSYYAVEVQYFSLNGVPCHSSPLALNPFVDTTQVLANIWVYVSARLDGSDYYITSINTIAGAVVINGCPRVGYIYATTNSSTVL